MITPEEARKSIDFLLQRFKLERYIYLSVTVASVVILGIAVYHIILNGDYIQILSMLAPTGVITFTCSRILKIWSDCLSIYKQSLGGNDSENNKNGK